MKKYEQLDTVIELANQNRKNRNIEVVYFNDPDKHRYIDILRTNNITPESLVIWTADYTPPDKKSGYVILLKSYDNQVKNKFSAKGYAEMSDFIFLNPQTTTIQGINIQNYSDRYGNLVKNLPNNLKLIINGYGNKIEFGENIVFGENSFIKIENKSVFRIGAFSRFGANTEIIVLNKAVFDLQKCSFGKSNWIKVSDYAVLLMKYGCTFIEHTEMALNANCRMEIGADVLVAKNVVFRAGDGHSLFDVITGEKRNLSDNEKDNTTIISNHVWIGSESTIINPTFIGSGCTVGTHSVVKGSYPNNCVLAGAVARVVRKNSSWTGYQLETNFKASGACYAVPTIELSKVCDSSLLSLCKITDMKKYLSTLITCEQKIVVIAVRDTAGLFIESDVISLLNSMGVESNLKQAHQQSYAALIDDNTLVYECLAKSKSDVVSYEGKLREIEIKIISNGYLCGNKAEIFVGGFDYSTNNRGINIVVYDKCSQQVVDSVCFDSHVQGSPCIRKLSTC